MHSLWSRGSHVVTQAWRVVGVLAVVLAVVSYFQLSFSDAFNLDAKVSNVVPKVTIRTTRRSGSLDGKPKENLRAKFDLDADLTPLFHWNTKQVFVYLTADYPGARDDIENSVTFWDAIITDKSKADIHLKDARGKYNVWDVAPSFDHRHANVTLRWQVQPHVGFMVGGEANIGDVGFDFPGPSEEGAQKPQGRPRRPKAQA